MNEDKSSSVQIESSPPPLSRDQFIDHLFPVPQGFFLRLSIEGRASSTEVYLQRRHRWVEVGNWGLADAPTLDTLAVAHKWGRVRFGPTLVRAPVESELGPLHNIWCAWPVAILDPPHPFLGALKRATSPGSAPAPSPVARIDQDAKQRVLDLIANIDPLPPHVVIDEGDRIVALWRLAEPLTEPFAESFHWAKMRSTRLLHSLAIQLGANARTADEPHRMTIDLPRSKRDDLDVFPTPIVSATITPDAKPVPIEELETYAAQGMTQAIRHSRGRSTA